MISSVLLKKILVEQRTRFLANKEWTPRVQLEEIREHIASPFAVVISGLRRAGKSTFLAQIAQRYYQGEDFYYAHFEDERLLRFSVEDFETLLLTEMELFGEKKCFFFDEIQNMPGWEIFVRRLMDQKYKVYVTGSNASLLSKELGTRLTGRYIPIELYPFSFEECLLYRGVKIEAFLGPLDTQQEAKLKRHFNKYLEMGGIVEAFKYPELDIHETIYNDILYRDIVARYQIESVKELKELSFHLLSNISKPLSFNKLKQQLMLGSVNTVKKFVEYLENSWLIFLVNSYAASVKKQQIAPKKVYAIDTGLVQSVAFHTSSDRGRYFENIVFIELRKKFKEIFYFSTKQGLEVDFLLRKERLLVQACSDFRPPEARHRELRATTQALEELGWKRAFIFTESEEEEIKVGKLSISVLPLNRWMISGSVFAKYK